MFIKVLKLTFAVLAVSACSFGCKQPAQVAKPAKPGEMPPAAGKEAAVIETSRGRIVIEFFPEVAPGTVANFKKLARKGFYDGTTFHRVIPAFMIQGGCPNSKDDNPRNDGQGGPGYTIKAEFSDRRHRRGIISMARSSDPDSAGSQFFVCVGDSLFLDGKYTIFGQVIEGMSTADAIVAAPRDPRSDRPLKNITMTVKLESR